MVLDKHENPALGVSELGNANWALESESAALTAVVLSWTLAIFIFKIVISREMIWEIFSGESGGWDTV